MHPTISASVAPVLCYHSLPMLEERYRKRSVAAWWPTVRIVFDSCQLADLAVVLPAQALLASLRIDYLLLDH